MNKDQTALLEWITAGLQISEVRSLRGDAAYLLNNMIAKYSLAASEYLLSEQALARLQSDGFDLSRTYKRSGSTERNPSTCTNTPCRPHS